MPLTRSGPAYDDPISTSLAANRLGPWHVSGAISSSVAPLTVTAAIIPLMIGSAGLLGVPLGFAGVACVLLLFSAGYSSMALDIPNAGSFYSYAARGLGRPYGVGVAWVALATYAAFQNASFGGFGVQAANLLAAALGDNARWVSPDVMWVVLAIIAWLITAILGSLNVMAPANVMLGLVLTETALVVLFNVALIASGRFHFSAAPLDPGLLTISGLGVLAVIGFTGFAGFEQGANFIEESRKKSTVVIATIGTVLGLAALYIMSSEVMISAAGPKVVEQAGHDQVDFFFNEAADVLGRWALWGGRILFATSVLAAAIAFHSANSRYLFALGRENLMPKMLGRTTAQNAPRNASWAQSVLGLAVILVWAVAGWNPLTTLFFWGGTSGGYGVMLLLTITSLSILVFYMRDRRGRSLWRTFVAPLASVLLLGGIAVLATLNLPLLYGVTGHTGPALFVPLTIGLLFLGGIVYGLAVKFIKPEIYQGIGYGTRAVASGGAGRIDLLADDLEAAK